VEQIEDPDINPHSYVHLSFDKTYDGEKTTLARETGYLHAEN
jgi:hypothetical protein